MGVRFLLVIGILASPGLVLANDKADRVFLNGRVWTGDPARPRAEALAVRGPRILAVGTTAQIRKKAEKGTDVVDLKGGFVVPGFIDAHQHFLSGSLSMGQLDLAGCDNVTRLQDRLAAHGQSRPDAPWIVGQGWGYADFPNQKPHRTHIDAVVKDRPVFLRDRDHHAALANTRAFALAGITRATRDPEGGIIERDEAGEPTGLLKEAATELVSRHVPKPSEDERVAAARQGLLRAASLGITSVHEAGVDDAELALLDRLEREGLLTLRFYVALQMVKKPSADQLTAQASVRSGHQRSRVRVDAVKGLLDGTVDSKTAWMFEPYVGGGTGLPDWTVEELEQSILAYDREGWQVQIHAVGDRAIAATLDAYEKASRTNGTRGRRHRIEHIEVPRPADLPRFKALDVMASTQAMFALPDKTTLENYSALLGPKRAASANAFRRFDEAGAVQAFGSDWPVFPNDILLGIFVAATRQTPEGTPAGGWHPEARISVEAALRHFTRDAAYAAKEENLKGALKTEFLADFTVLSDDILAIPPAAIPKTRVLRTVVAGIDTYLAGGR